MGQFKSGEKVADIGIFGGDFVNYGGYRSEGSKLECGKPLTKSYFKGDYRGIVMNRPAGQGIHDEAVDFIEWLGELKQDGVFEDVVMIAGNHDVMLDPQRDSLKAEAEGGLVHGPDYYRKEISDRGIVYLEDNAKNVQGISIFGSPRTPKRHWDDAPTSNAFESTQEELKDAYAKIPVGIDILVTHSHAFCDKYQKDFKNKALLDAVHRVRPQFHFWGHEHDDTLKHYVEFPKTNGNPKSRPIPEHSWVLPSGENYTTTQLGQHPNKTRFFNGAQFFMLCHGRGGDAPVVSVTPRE